MKFSSYALCSAAALATSHVASAQNMGFGGQIMNQEDFNKFDAMSELERLVALTKNQWPECLHGDANECENLIKAELDSMDLSFPVQTVIIYTRNKNSPTAHAWVVPIDDNGMCIGKHKDGRIFYEYEWCVDEEEPLTDAAAIKESKKLIKPSKWAKIACERKKDLECDYDEPNEPGTGGNSNGNSGDGTGTETDTAPSDDGSGGGDNGDDSDTETDTAPSDDGSGGGDSGDDSDSNADSVTTVTEVSEPSDDGSGGGNNNNNNGINGDGNPNSSNGINNGNGGSGENNGSQGTGNSNSNAGGNNGGGNSGGGNNNNNNGINGDGNPNSSIEINNGNGGSGENNGSQGTGNSNSNAGGNNGNGDGNSNKDKRRLLSQIEYVSGLKEWRQNILDDVGVGGDFEPVCSTYDGIQKILEVRANGPIVNKGCQRLPAINCLGLSGIDTCKMIKEMVPYPNKKGKNMECFLQYLPNSPKRGEIQRDLAGAGHNTKDKVVIYAVYETNRVIATPQMNGPNSEIGSV
eukprot:CAMPEP_0171385752 /NCGR_PEP_ID=MMETSP0879-20121228/39143_1 /TAXON_ID=67004 /ORGANISM="Thalassiosira weissflogii, Strain CCMP1336" /LENGTH=519 /DNA_ID=CAMNT_0011898055 /DNA_START=41 /DNA_END=1600 /DNA_ORIENTATION=+